jgi:hypothetical protein
MTRDDRKLKDRARKQRRAACLTPIELAGINKKRRIKDQERRGNESEHAGTHA